LKTGSEVSGHQTIGQMQKKTLKVEKAEIFFEGE
jgi:hypothetical protein